MGLWGAISGLAGIVNAVNTGRNAWNSWQSRRSPAPIANQFTGIGSGSPPRINNDGGLSMGGITEPIISGLQATGNVVQAIGQTKQALQGLGGGQQQPSGTELGERHRAFLEAAYPGTNPWEQLGASGSPQQADHARIEREKLRTQEKIAKLQTDTQKENVRKQTQAQRDVANISAQAQIQARSILPEATAGLQTAQTGLAEEKMLTEQAQRRLIGANISLARARELAKMAQAELAKGRTKATLGKLPHEIQLMIADKRLTEERKDWLPMANAYSAAVHVANLTGTSPELVLSAMLITEQGAAGAAAGGLVGGVKAALKWWSKRKAKKANKGLYKGKTKETTKDAAKRKLAKTLNQ